MNPTTSGSSSTARPVGSATAFPIAKHPTKPLRKSISQRDKEVWEQSFLAFPAQYPFLMVALERCPRVCNCTGCFRPIKCGDQRLHFYIKVPRQEGRAGGVIMRRSMFVHPACFFAKCQSNTDDAVVWGWGLNVCYDCHREMPEEDYGCFFASPGLGTAALCRVCSEQARWRKCHSCCLFFAPSKVLRAPDDDDGRQWLCKLCHQQFDFPTFKDVEVAQTEIVDEIEFVEAFKAAVLSGEAPPVMPAHIVRKMRMGDRQFSLLF